MNATVWMLALVPVAGGALVWSAAPRARMPAGGHLERRKRVTAAALACVTLGVTLAIAIWAAGARPEAQVAWSTTIDLRATLASDVSTVMAILVPSVALPIALYTAAKEPLRGLHRLLGILVAFVGAMQLLVIAGDLLTLLVGWELVGWASWALIAHDWREADKPAAAAHAFNATRFGDLGLFLAAMAAFATAGSFAYDDLLLLDGWHAHVFVAGVVLAAAAKSAQGPFAPWLLSAMGGPTPVSALLHAATMVAAGAYLLARLHEPLAAVPWFGPSVIALGLATALLGGLAASVQTHIKKVLAASTSAHYGLVLVAIGAGSTAAGIAHLVAHAAFKAALFLAAGIAITAVGSPRLGVMRLGSDLPATRRLTFVVVLALAGVPPLGAAFTKEKVVAAAGHEATWLAVLVAVAGGLSAFYALRFHLLAFGRTTRGPRVVRRPRPATVLPLALLAAVSVALGVAWVPGGEAVAGRWIGGALPARRAWEIALSLGLVAVALYTAHGADREDRLAHLGMAAGSQERTGDWFGLPAATKAAIVDPFLAACRALARFDDRIVDAGVRAAARLARALSDGVAVADVRAVDEVVRRIGVAGLGLARAAASAADPVLDSSIERFAGGIGFAGRDSRRLQSGLAHHYYVIVVLGLGLLAGAAALWR